MASPDCLFLLSQVAVRDPNGFRPLCIGRISGGGPGGSDGYVVASETCALVNLASRRATFLSHFLFLRVSCTRLHHSSHAPGDLLVIANIIRRVRLASL